MNTKMRSETQKPCQACGHDPAKTQAIFDQQKATIDALADPVKRQLQLSAPHPMIVTQPNDPKWEALKVIACHPCRSKMEELEANP